jgi:hypothetical protein
MTHRENLIRAYRLRSPEWIPVASGFPAPCWEYYGPDALEDLLSSHQIMFPGYERGSIYPDNVSIPPHTRKDQPFTDAWGSVWVTNVNGMVGAVKQHALTDWGEFENYRAPSPEQTDGMLPLDWECLGIRAARCRGNGDLFAVGLPHGHTFLRLQDLRGYENLVYDMADEEPRLWKLIAMVEEFNLDLVHRFLRLAPDMVRIPEDLGAQSGPLISPDMFRKYIKPSYLRLTAPIKEAGILVHEHSDGDIIDLVDDLVEVGGDVLNLQDLVNGIDRIREHVMGRLAIDLDIDRQRITVHGSPRDIDDHIREAVMKLGSREGGLSLCYQPWPPTPLENIRAVFDAMERYCGYYS